MKLARISAIVAAAAIAPAVLFSSPAVAAEGTQPVTTSVPDTAPDTKPADPAHGSDSSADDDRVAILRILADKNTGRAVREAAQKALDGTPEDLRYFLEVGQYQARLQDDRVRIAQIISDGGPSLQEAGEAALTANTPEAIKYFLEVGQYQARLQDDRVRVARIINFGGPAVREAGIAALRLGTPEAIKYFLEVGQYKAKFEDDQVKVSQIINAGGPEVQKAGKAALRTGTPESIKYFLEVGQYEARAKDKAAEDAANNKPTPTPGTGDKPTTGDQPKPGTEVSGKPAAVVTSAPNAAAPAGNSGTELASTGAGDTPQWAVGGAVVALGAGAGLALMNRRRPSAGR
ncbi:ALF repeat-containing protein [Streptomyces sp. H39-C1]|uniref:ALF repeat-containing protein n=1 Tax=Streptomyces sp. H39-C1 TaxID=3004355 RepID=UPI0022B02A20|nr:ALF repeat-containing protein [Streptomyces sp. H39-C1]MCZ4095255.1 ALF repeat-containing protein [Streptomyces sp. H39-C1]